MEEVTLETLAILVIGSLLLTTLLWSFLYIMMVRKFGAVFKMLEVLGIGLSTQNSDIGKNQTTLFNTILEKHKILENTLEGEKEGSN